MRRAAAFDDIQGQRIPLDDSVISPACSFYCARHDVQEPQGRIPIPDCSSCFQDEVVEAALCCDCGAVYPVIDAIPRLLPESATEYAEFLARHGLNPAGHRWQRRRIVKVHRPFASPTGAALGVSISSGRSTETATSLGSRMMLACASRSFFTTWKPPRQHSEVNLFWTSIAATASSRDRSRNMVSKSSRWTSRGASKGREIDWSRRASRSRTAYTTCKATCSRHRFARPASTLSILRACFITRRVPTARFVRLHRRPGEGASSMCSCTVVAAIGSTSSTIHSGRSPRACRCGCCTYSVTAPRHFMPRSHASSTICAASPRRRAQRPASGQCRCSTTTARATSIATRCRRSSRSSRVKVTRISKTSRFPTKRATCSRCLGRRHGAVYAWDNASELSSIV